MSETVHFSSPPPFCRWLIFVALILNYTRAGQAYSVSVIELWVCICVPEYLNISSCPVKCDVNQPKRMGTATER